MDINSSTYFFMYDSYSQTGIFQNVVPFTVLSILPRFQFIKLKPFFFDLNQILYFSGNEWWFLEFNFWRTKSSLMTVLFISTPCTVLTVKYLGLPTKDETSETTVRNYTISVSLHLWFPATVNLFMSLLNHIKRLNSWQKTIFSPNRL